MNRKLSKRKLEDVTGVKSAKRRAHPLPRLRVDGRGPHARENDMTDLSRIQPHMEVIGADGVHLGTVDRIEGDRIKLTKNDSGEGAHKGHHHYVPAGLVADVEGQKVRLSANADVAVLFEEEADRSARQ
jgi:hypothetical protein